MGVHSGRTACLGWWKELGVQGNPVSHAVHQKRGASPRGGLPRGAGGLVGERSSAGSVRGEQVGRVTLPRTGFPRLKQTRAQPNPRD